MFCKEEAESWDDEGNRCNYKSEVVWEKTYMAHEFPGSMCPAGTQEINLVFNLPENMPQSFLFTGPGVQIKLCYFFMAQVVPWHPYDVED